MRKVLFIVIAILLVCSFVHAEKVGTFGKLNSSGVAPLEVDSDRIITITADAGLKTSYERVTADNTLVAADSGKTISISDVAGIDFNLPTAAVGMSFTFVAESTNSWTLNPADADTIRYNDMAAGDQAKIGGATYSSLSIFCTQPLYWVVENLIGGLIDSN